MMSLPKMYFLFRKIDKKSPNYGLEKGISDEEGISDKINFKTRLNQAKSESQSMKKVQTRPVTAGKITQLANQQKTPKIPEAIMLARIRPRNSGADKEKLYEENLELKQKNNVLNEENTKLKTKLYQVEKELTKKEEADEENPIFRHPNHLIVNLKNIIKDLKTQVSEKTTEVDLLKKNLKSSKINEMEIEMKAYIDEDIRLRHHLEEILKFRDTELSLPDHVLENNIRQSMISEALQKQNQELQLKIIKLEEEKEIFQAKIAELDKRKKRTRKKTDTSNNKTDILKLQIDHDSISKNFQAKEINYKEQITHLQKVINEFEQENNEYKLKIEEFENKTELLLSELKILRKESLNKSKEKIQKAISKKFSNPPKILIIINRIVESKNMIVTVLMTLIDKNNIGVVDIDDFYKKMISFYPNFKKKYIELVWKDVGCRGNMINLAKLEEIYEKYEYDNIFLSSSSEEESAPDMKKKKYNEEENKSFSVIKEDKEFKSIDSKTVGAETFYKTVGESKENQDKKDQHFTNVISSKKNEVDVTISKELKSEIFPSNKSESREIFNLNSEKKELLNKNEGCTKHEEFKKEIDLPDSKSYKKNEDNIIAKINESNKPENEKEKMIACEKKSILDTENMKFLNEKTVENDSNKKAVNKEIGNEKKDVSYKNNEEKCTVLADSKTDSLVNLLLLHISFRLQMNRIPVASMHSVLFKNIPKNHSIPSSLLKTIFKNPPINFTEPGDHEKLLIFFGENCTVGEIIDKLIKVTGAWQIYTQKQEKIFDELISAKLTPIVSKLKDLCRIKAKESSDILYSEDFFNILLSLNTTFEPDCKKYMELLFYSYDFVLFSVPYENFLSIYCEKTEMSEEQRANLVRSCLQMIADALKQDDKTAGDAFETNKNRLIDANSFIAGIQKLGLNKIGISHINIMIEAMQDESSEEQGINIEELNSILTHYGVGYEGSFENEDSDEDYSKSQEKESLKLNQKEEDLYSFDSQEYSEDSENEYSESYSESYDEGN